MPTFEFTTPDKRVFQLDAPDQQTAIQKWQQAQSQLPPPPPTDQQKFAGNAFNTFSDAAASVGSNLVPATVGVATQPGDVASAIGTGAGWLTGFAGKSPQEQADIGNFVRRSMPIIGNMPNFGEVWPGFQQATGFQPYQSKTEIGAHTGEAARFIPGAMEAGLSGGATLPVSVMRGAGTGAMSVLGGDVAAGVSGEPNRPIGQLGGALIGGYLTSKFPSPSKQAAANAPTSASVKTAENAAYGAVDNSGIVIKAASVKGMLQDVLDAGEKIGIGRTTPGANAAKMDLEDAIASGKDLSFRQLEALRRVVREGQKDGSAASGAMTAKFTDWLDNKLNFADTLGGVDTTATQGTLQTARQTAQTRFKIEDVEDIFKTANRFDRIDQPGKYETAIRQGFDRLVQDPNFEKFWTADEQTAIKTAAKGGGFEPQLLRYLGAKTRSLLGLGAGFVTGGAPGGLATGQIGGTLSGLGNQGSMAAANVAKAIIASGVNPFAATVPPGVQGVAQALAGASLPARAPPQANPFLLPNERRPLF